MPDNGSISKRLEIVHLANKNAFVAEFYNLFGYGKISYMDALQSMVISLAEENEVYKNIMKKEL